MPASTKHALNLPPGEAIRFFRQKVTLPSDRWTDLWQGMHSRAFVVAGATSESILSDIRTAVDDAIANGTTIEKFREMWDEKIENSGWDYKGGRDWRTRVIFQTNLSTAYHAGRYKRRMRPINLKARPYNRYIPSHAAEQREEHTPFYNVVLPAKHKFWDTHTPPNGWGCKCGIQSLSETGKKRIEKRFKYSSNPMQTKPPKVETYKWQDKFMTGPISVPKNIDPGWAYNVGKATYGAPMSEQVAKQWAGTGSKQWRRLTPITWADHGRPKLVPVEPVAAKTGRKIATAAGAIRALKKILDADEKVFSITSASGFPHSTIVNAEALVKHVPSGKHISRFYPLLPEIFNEPFEAWHDFEQHKGTGKVRLRTRIIKGVKLKNGKAYIAVVQTVKGYPETIRFIPATKQNGAEILKQRTGKLFFARGA